MWKMFQEYRKTLHIVWSYKYELGKKMKVHIFQICLPNLLCGFLSIYNACCGIDAEPDPVYNDIDILENDFEEKGKW